MVMTVNGQMQLSKNVMCFSKMWKGGKDVGIQQVYFEYDHKK
jgi:hypothetical protein